MVLNFIDKATELQLDIVGLLAVVGESAMAGHVQAVTATWTALLPRFIPAPQSFLATERPYRLPSNKAVKGVVAILSGNYVHELNFFPNLLHGIDEMKHFTVREITIKRPMTRAKTSLVGEGSPSKNIHPKKLGPINILAVLGFLCFIGLLIGSILAEDGMAVVATVLLAFTSCLLGLANKWDAELQTRKVTREVPPGDAVVLGRQGAMIIVRCDEHIARELYFGTERCVYSTSERTFQVLAAVGTLMFMGSVVFLANCTWPIQASVGLIYICLNGLYWAAALVPARLHWDLSGYEVEERAGTKIVTHSSYTDVLIEVIKRTGEIRWLKQASAVPETDAWNTWLVEAKEKVHNLEWNGQDRLTALLKGIAPSTAGFQPEHDPDAIQEDRRSRHSISSLRSKILGQDKGANVTVDEIV